MRAAGDRGGRGYDKTVTRLRLGGLCPDCGESPAGTRAPWTDAARDRWFGGRSRSGSSPSWLPALGDRPAAGRRQLDRRGAAAGPGPSLGRGRVLGLRRIDRVAGAAGDHRPVQPRSPTCSASTTELRVWWRGNQDWRVDEITPSGEQDLARRRDRTCGRGTTSRPASNSIRTWPRRARTLPRADDLVPASLARRLLSQARPGEVHRIASKRVAGSDGRRAALRPGRTAVDDRAGRRVGAARARGCRSRSRSTANRATAATRPCSWRRTMLDLDTGRAAGSSTAFVPPPGGAGHTQQAPDLLALAGRVQNFTLPPTLGGLSTRFDLAAEHLGHGVRHRRHRAGGDSRLRTDRRPDPRPADQGGRQCQDRAGNHRPRSGR